MFSGDICGCSGGTFHKNRKGVGFTKVDEIGSWEVTHTLKAVK